ncbi:uncharacterized protein ATC70_010490 [Mucor velutinosus]|uniref:CCHC-type domain-containing protein n=2 Tax=Mucor velutinosus TaxID=708070 RepID=A0AAN7D5X0_9FUNG|nr:hypothetical protein ATC70_007042 [Mucor velutinosus]KAK4510449.1 hypothetical protein ATC70_004879 [Mucor velutinosus]KAK4515540.1 hypothetical protein ATC70_010490 [Mucor velutinosus]
MASSAKKQSDNSDPPTQGGSMDSSHNPSNQLFTYQSFTDALKEQKRHNFEVVPDVDNNTFKPLNTYSTFIEAKERNSIVIDCAQFLGMEFKDTTLLKVLREQFPKCLGLKPRIIGKNRKKAIELGFSTENLCRDALLKEFKVNGKVIEVNKTLNHTANVINIGISEIPLMEEDELKPALIKTFERYGDILNIGISKSGDSDWFTGRGFATLNRDKLKESTYANTLTPQVELEGFPGAHLHLVWSQMKPICTDCHTDEHVRLDCPKRRRRLCHRCKSPNHLIAKCPVAPWNNKSTENSNETKSSKSTPGSNENEFQLVSRRNSSSREVNLLDLVKQGQPQQPASQNQFEILNHEVEMGEVEEVEESQGNEENDTEKSTSLDKGVKMSRSSSELANKKPFNVTPSVTQSTPRLATRSNQTLKLTDVDKLTPSKSKRNLDDAISPNGQQETVPFSKKKNTKKNESSTNEAAGSSNTSGSGKPPLNKLD